MFNREAQRNSNNCFTKSNKTQVHIWTIWAVGVNWIEHIQVSLEGGVLVEVVVILSTVHHSGDCFLFSFFYFCFSMKASNMTGHEVELTLNTSNLFPVNSCYLYITKMCLLFNIFNDYQVKVSKLDICQMGRENKHIRKQGSGACHLSFLFDCAFVKWKTWAVWHGASPRVPRRLDLNVLMRHLVEAPASITASFSPPPQYCSSVLYSQHGALSLHMRLLFRITFMFPSVLGGSDDASLERDYFRSHHGIKHFWVVLLFCSFGCFFTFSTLCLHFW